MAGNDLHAGGPVVRVLKPDSGTRHAFHEHLVPVLDELVGRRWKQCHTILLLFDFLGDADDHGPSIAQLASTGKNPK